jgi:hypothetical protein
VKDLVNAGRGWASVDIVRGDKLMAKGLAGVKSSAFVVVATREDGRSVSAVYRDWAKARDARDGLRRSLGIVMTPTGPGSAGAPVNVALWRSHIERGRQAHAAALVKSDALAPEAAPALDSRVGCALCGARGVLRVIAPRLSLCEPCRAHPQLEPALRFLALHASKSTRPTDWAIANSIAAQLSPEQIGFLSRRLCGATFEQLGPFPMMRPRDEEPQGQPVRQQPVDVNIRVSGDRDFDIRRDDPGDPLSYVLRRTPPPSDDVDRRELKASLASPEPVFRTAWERAKGLVDDGWSRFLTLFGHRRDDWYRDHDGPSGALKNPGAVRS